MTTFKIDAENNITALTSSEQIAEGAGETETFRSRKELAALAEKWPATRLVEIFAGRTNPGNQNAVSSTWAARSPSLHCAASSQTRFTAGKGEIRARPLQASPPRSSRPRPRRRETLRLAPATAKARRWPGPRRIRVSTGFSAGPAA